MNREKTAAMKRKLAALPTSEERDFVLSMGWVEHGDAYYRAIHALRMGMDPESPEFDAYVMKGGY